MTQIVDAIYVGGVLKPLEPINVKEYTRVHLTIEVEEERKKKAEEVIEMARKSCEGHSEEEISILEGACLNTDLFFPNRVDSK